jgi:hypothetical protein
MNCTIQHTCIRDPGRILRYQVYNAVTERALTGTDAPGSILEAMKVHVPNEYTHALPTDAAVRRRIRSQRFKARGGRMAAVHQQHLVDVHDVPASVVNVDWPDGRVECVLKNDSGPGRWVQGCVCLRICVQDRTAFCSCPPTTCSRIRPT